MSNLLLARAPLFKRFHSAKLRSRKVKLPESLNNSLTNQMANFLKNKDFKWSKHRKKSKRKNSFRKRQTLRVRSLSVQSGGIVGQKCHQLGRRIYLRRQQCWRTAKSTLRGKNWWCYWNSFTLMWMTPVTRWSSSCSKKVRTSSWSTFSILTPRICNKKPNLSATSCWLPAQKTLQISAKFSFPCLRVSLSTLHVQVFI